MKKILYLLMILLVLVSGCGKKVDDKEKNTTTSTTTASTTTTSATSTTKKTTTTSSTTKKTTTATKAKEKNVYKSVKTGKEHKYTFVYSDETTCGKRGDADAFDIVNPVHPYVVFGCEEIEDSNGNRLWGVYFYEQADENSIFYY